MAILHLDEPTLIVEVLSASTEAKDRLEKLAAYQSLPSVKEYLLLAQDKVQAEIYRRSENDWLIESLTYGDTLNLLAIDYSSSIETFYEDVIGVPDA